MVTPDLRFEEPVLGVVQGVEPHGALYRDRRRFPALGDVVLTGLYSGADAAIAAYNVYLKGEHCSVFDYVWVRHNRIWLVQSVMGRGRSPEPRAGAPAALWPCLPC